MTAVLVLAVGAVAVALASRSPKLSLLAGVLCFALGYYLAGSGLVDVARRDVADAVSSAAAFVAGLVPGIAG